MSLHTEEGHFLCRPFWATSWCKVSDYFIALLVLTARRIFFAQFFLTITTIFSSHVDTGPLLRGCAQEAIIRPPKRTLTYKSEGFCVHVWFQCVWCRHCLPHIFMALKGWEHPCISSLKCLFFQFIKEILLDVWRLLWFEIYFAIKPPLYDQKITAIKG